MKTARRVLVLLLVLLLAIPAAVVTLLTTSYADSTWQWVSKSLNLPFNADSIHYDFPYHLTVNQLRTNTEHLPYIEQLDVWLNPDVYRNGQWIIDSLLIDGANLQHGLPPLPNLEGIFFHQVALKNIDYADKQFSANGVNLQIKSPQWTHSPIPYGEMQLSADQIYWHGEAFNQVLFDLDYKAQDSTLYGASFHWRNSQVSGQAEQYQQGWSLINVTINKLQLNASQIQSMLAKPWGTLPIQINHINSLDLLNADIEWQDWQWQNLELSVEDAALPFALWNANTQLSLQADSVRFQQQTAIEPRLSAVFNPEEIQLNELSFDWQQGRVQASGRLTPTLWQLDRASVQGIKWTITPEDDYHWWRAATRKLADLSIEQLDIEHSQIIQLTQKPYWQLSGLNLEGQQLVFKPSTRHWSLWQGELDAAVVNASYDQILASHAALTMHSKNGLWQLTRLFAPLEHGYIEGNGQINLNSVSQPWTLNLNADGLPLRLFHRYLPTMLALEGLSEFNLKLQGLAGDHDMLAYSLSGEVSANLRETHLTNPDDQVRQAVVLSPLQLQAHRGEITIQPMTIAGETLKGEIFGAFDMTQRPLTGIKYQLHTECGAIDGDLLSGEIRHNSCLKAPEATQAPVGSKHSHKKGQTPTSSAEAE